jgi:DNA-binding MarR family transcriptional regulator
MSDATGLANLGRIDEVIHGRMRLGIMVYLADAEVAEFTELKSALEATQGNLSVHLKKLEEAGYVAIDKSFRDNKPLTRVSITPDGRRAFASYLDALGGLIGKTPA